jgi:hypothetical protein
MHISMVYSAAVVITAVPRRWVGNEQVISVISSHTLCLNFPQHLESNIMFYCWIAPRMNHDVK